MANKTHLIPEWEPQEAIILSWPDDKTDWAPWLGSVWNTYLDIITQLSLNDTGVILLIRPEAIQHCLAQLKTEHKVLLVAADYNDTWVRDYGFLTCYRPQGPSPVEFCFNGWGNKFKANKDNSINQQYLAQLCQQPIQSYDLVLEGGAIEIDQDGLLLSTKLCLTNPERNGKLSLKDYQRQFSLTLGTTRSIIFEHGHLEGDDTDGHIDTLVRFTPNKGIVIQSSFNRPSDGHFNALNALIDECKTLLPEHALFELPLPFVVSQQGDRLPASYANYLISNKTILAPIYQQPEDKAAISILQSAYPDYKIAPINCLPLIQQYGSLHCISMQVPEGTLKPHIIDLFAKGVSQYEN